MLPQTQGSRSSHDPNTNSTHGVSYHIPKDVEINKQANTHTQCHTPKKQQVSDPSFRYHSVWSSNLWGLTPKQLSSLELSLFTYVGFFNHRYLVMVEEQNMSLRPHPRLLNTKIENHHTRWLFRLHLSSFTLNTSIISYMATLCLLLQLTSMFFLTFLTMYVVLMCYVMNIMYLPRFSHR